MMMMIGKISSIFIQLVLFAHFQLLSRVELKLFKNWFVFHTNGLFAHSQLSRMKDTLKIGVVENLFKN